MKALFYIGAAALVLTLSACGSADEPATNVAAYDMDTMMAIRTIRSPSLK